MKNIKGDAVRILFVSLLTALVAGCSKPPACTDPRVQAIVEEMVVDSFNESAGTNWKRALELKLDLLATESFNGDAHQWSCSARVTLIPKNGALDVLNAHAKFLHEVVDSEKSSQQPRLLGTTGEVSLSPLNTEVAMSLAMRSWKDLDAGQLRTNVTYSSRFSEDGEKALVVGISKLGLILLDLPVKLAKVAYDAADGRQKEAQARAQKEAQAKKPINLGAAYFVRIWKDDGTVEDVNESQVFANGGRFQLGVKVSRPSFVYIYSQDGSGSFSKLYPHSGQRNFTDARGVFFLPVEEFYKFDSNPGTEQLSVYLAPQPVEELTANVLHTKPDLVYDPDRMHSSTDAPCGVQSATHGPQVPMANVSDPMASKAIGIDTCIGSQSVSSRAIVFGDTSLPANAGQVFSYVIRQNANSQDVLHLQLNLVHR